jgi:GntR family transcriptional regulator
MPPPLGLTVAPNSGIPIYRQLVDQVRAQVVGGRLGEGQYLPSVRQVAEELEINPMTVSKAYSILEREGVVEGVRGTGMRVKSVEGNGRAKVEMLMPLLRQVAATARQLNVPGGKVIEVLRPLLKQDEAEADHE